MKIQTSTNTGDVILAIEFQKHLSDISHKNVVIGQGKYRKRASKQKWTERNYHVQNNADVTYIGVKMCCVPKQFPPFTFCGPQSKPHGVWGLRKLYHLILNKKLVHRT